jgi:hypothetical protein
MSQTQCTHPPRRLYGWTAFDGTFVVACCQCGAVLKGAAPETPKEWDREQAAMGRHGKKTKSDI